MLPQQFAAPQKFSIKFARKKDLVKIKKGEKKRFYNGYVANIQYVSNQCHANIAADHPYKYFRSLSV